MALLLCWPPLSGALATASTCCSSSSASRTKWRSSASTPTSTTMTVGVGSATVWSDRDVLWHVAAARVVALMPRYVAAVPAQQLTNAGWGWRRRDRHGLGDVGRGGESSCPY
jgi:hypothetical protein